MVCDEEALLAEVLEFYNIKCPAVSVLEGGHVNTNWLVVDGKKKYVLRRGSSYKTKKSLEWEMGVLNTLASDLDYEIPRPVFTLQEQLYVSHQQQLYSLHQHVKGTSHTPLTGKDLSQVGIMMSALHESLAQVHTDESNRNKAFDIEHLAQGLGLLVEFFTNNESNFSKYFLSHYAQIQEDLILEPPEEYFQVPKQLIHGDLWHPNLHFTKDTLTGIIDFDNMQIDTKVRDLAVVICDECTCEGLDRTKVEKLLETYTSHQNLSKSEAQLIVPLIINHAATAFWFLSHKVKNGASEAHYLKGLKWSVNTVNWYKVHEKDAKNIFLKFAD